MWKAVAGGGSPSWQSFGTTWDAVSTSPAIGNGTLTSRYVQTGDLVVASWWLNPGSTTTFGTGEWTFTLPVAAMASRQLFTGAAWAFDSGGAPWYAATCRATSTTVVRIVGNGEASHWKNDSPFTWVDADSAGWSITYEAA